MLDTLALLTYLISQHPNTTHSMQLHSKIIAAHVSPELTWRGVPPSAQSLAFIAKDKKSHYNWVVYNISPDTHCFPAGASGAIRKYDEGWNSWGARNYHATPSVSITVYALDKRFSSIKKITGKMLEKKMAGHIIACAQATWDRDIVVPQEIVENHQAIQKK